MDWSSRCLPTQLGSLAAPAAVPATQPDANCTERPMVIQGDVDKATDFLATCAAGQVRQAYEAYVSDDFRHHNA
jgi:hypothetical protein